MCRHQLVISTAVLFFSFAYLAFLCSSLQVSLPLYRVALFSSIHFWLSALLSVISVVFLEPLPCLGTSSPCTQPCPVTLIPRLFNTIVSFFVFLKQAKVKFSLSAKLVCKYPSSTTFISFDKKILIGT